VAVDAISGLTVPAAVTYIQPTATIQSGVVNYGVTVELKPANAAAGTAAGAGAVPSASLRQGLSVTVNIVKTTNNNVLLVPNRAIIRQGTATTAQVVDGSGAIEVRTITTGAGDNRNTEVTRGLAEGEKIVLQAAANRTSTPAAGGMFGGGGGRPPFAGSSMGGS
jgi:HlyD family secretion protein